LHVIFVEKAVLPQRPFCRRNGGLAAEKTVPIRKVLR